MTQERFSLKKINKHLKHEGLRLENVQAASWFVLYKLESAEEIDGLEIREWERICEIPNNGWRESEESE